MDRIASLHLPALLRRGAFALFALAASAAGVETDDEPAETDTSPAYGLALRPKQQAAGGITLVALQAASLQAEIGVHGRVADISPLLELRTRYRAALSEYRIAEAARNLSLRNRDRLAQLTREAIIASKDLISAESTLSADETRTTTARHRIQEIREEALHSWGPELFRLAIEEDSTLWEDLLSRRKVLLLIALPASATMPPGIRTIAVARNRDRAHAARAEWLSVAPNTDTMVQGETYFFTVAAQNLRTGMRVDAWIPVDHKPASGVFVPASAIVWYGGLPWAFVRTGTEGFARRPVADYQEFGDNWFVRSGFAVGDEVVTIGAQLLLSEEMRRQIPREDDD